MIRYLFVALMLISCREKVIDRQSTTNDLVENRVAAQNALENVATTDSAALDRIDPGDYSKQQLTEMATETGEVSTELLPELEFWDKVGKDGTFAAFQTALKQAKTLEERWRVVDNFPEIARRSGMTETLTPRDSLKTKK